MILRWKAIRYDNNVQVNQIIKVNGLYHLVTKVTEKLVFTLNNNRFQKKDISIMRAYTKTFNDCNELITVVPHYSVYKNLFKTNKVLEILPEVVELKVIGNLTKLYKNDVIRIIDLFVNKLIIDAGTYKVTEVNKKTVTVCPNFQPTRLLQTAVGMPPEQITENSTFVINLRRNQICPIDKYNKQYLLIN
jgi:hypothetical protein